MANTADQLKIGDRGDRTKQLDDRCVLLVGVDPTDKKTPRYLPIGPGGLKIDTEGGGLALPHYDDAVLSYYGATNNLQQVTYKLATATVATLLLTYAGGGAADDDKLIRVQRL